MTIQPFPYDNPSFSVLVWTEFDQFYVLTQVTPTEETPPVIANFFHLQYKTELKCGNIP